MSPKVSQTRLIFENTITFAASRLVDRAASICVSFLVARQLGAAALGIYATVLVYFGLICLAAQMGSATYLVREISKDRAQTGRYLLNLGALTISISFVVMTVAWLAVP